jgi:hypothetical protein
LYDDVLGLIFQYLEIRVRVLVVARVSWQWNRVVARTACHDTNMIYCEAETLPQLTHSPLAVHHISSLRVDCIENESQVHQLDSLHRLFRLHTLVLDMSVTAPSIPIDMITWTALRSLQFADTYFQNSLHLQHFLRLHGGHQLPHLEQIGFLYMDTSFLSILPELATQVPTLKTLQLYLSEVDTMLVVGRLRQFHGLHNLDMRTIRPNQRTLFELPVGTSLEWDHSQLVSLNLTGFDVTKTLREWLRLAPRLSALSFFDCGTKLTDFSDFVHHTLVDFHMESYAVARAIMRAFYPEGTSGSLKPPL